MHASSLSQRIRILLKRRTTRIHGRPRLSRTTPETRIDCHPAAVFQCPDLYKSHCRHLFQVTDQLGTAIGTKSSSDMCAIGACNCERFQFSYSFQRVRRYHHDSGLSAASHPLAVLTMTMVSGDNLVAIELIAEVAAEASTGSCITHCCLLTEIYELITV